MVRDRLNIIYEDKNMIVVNKPAHILTIATSDEKINTLYHKVHEYLYKKNKNNKVFIVHRLDKDTSGVILFAKSQNYKYCLQREFENQDVIREYIAIVEGNVKEKRGVIRQKLTETKTLLTVVSKDGVEAITDYEVLYNSKNYSILKINIKTGRKNQIRVALSSIHHPIIGDKKYGSTKNPLRRLCLHATRLVIEDPISKKKMEFVSSVPSEFKIFDNKKGNE